MGLYCVDCPECKALNYYSTGDPADQTLPDVEAVRCFKCTHAWILDDVEDVDSLEDAFMVDGVSGVVDEVHEDIYKRYRGLIKDIKLTLIRYEHSIDLDAHEELRKIVESEDEYAKNYIRRYDKS